MEERSMTLARSNEATDRITRFAAPMPDRQNKPAEFARAHIGQDDALLLQEISASLIQEGDIDALYERILDGAITLMASDMGSMQTFHPRQNELRLLAWRGFHPESAAFWDRISLDSVHTSCGVAFSSAHRIIVPDTEVCDFMAGSADLDHYRLSNMRAMQSTPLVSRSGELLGMISTHWHKPHHPSDRALHLLDVLARQAADLIERTRAEADLRVLCHEAEHRAKNVLATVQAMIQLSNADTADDLKRVLEGRIQALANSHALLVKSRWVGADLHSLVAQELLPYSQGGPGRAHIDGPNLSLEPNAAQTIGMIVHELTTNAAKYGALSKPDGQIDIQWSCASDKSLIIHWTETRGAPVKQPTHQGFGTRLMKAMMGSLKGDVHFNWREEGLSVEISVPLVNCGS